MHEPALLNEAMTDGSRLFLLLPENAAPLSLLARIVLLPGAWPTAYLPGVAESWIDFRYKGRKFSINNQLGDYWFFVDDPDCSDDVLREVALHFSGILLG